MTEAAAIETPVTEATQAPPPPPAAETAPAPRVKHADRLAAILAPEAKGDDAPAAEGDAPAATDDAPAKPKDPKADPSAAKFAALARENEKAVRLKQEVDAKASLVAERETKLTALETSLKERETKVAAAESRGLDLLEGNPAAIFDRLVQLGVDTPEKLQQLAQGKWKRPAPEVKPDDPNRPLTIREFEERQQHVRATEAEARAAAEFVKVSSDETKFEASNLLYSDAERVTHAQRIASGFIRAGKAVPSLADLALAVEALAQRDARWQKISKRSAKSAEAGSSTAGKPATTDPASIARAATGPKTPSNDSATETTPKLPPLTGSRKQQRQERLRRLFHPEG